ncbi:MAG: enoyl-CoA hydratase/isomerase family protein [Myxococcales bacterium]|nr:enoyl-CoA hydratase/isomerase family protein [Myxococcales bacterium]
MDRLSTMTYERTGRIARITLNRPERGNGITLEMPREIAACVERANLDPDVHVVALSGNGKGFCGGYDLVASAELRMAPDAAHGSAQAQEQAQAQAQAQAQGAAPGGGSPTDPKVIFENHDPSSTWDPMVDWQMMSRNVRGFMSLFHSGQACRV